jgi:lipid II:glycine glycyltransferase (peptidoglycan interpeptide bridge formation enzyme)
MRITRQKIEDRLYHDTGLVTSFRENMPLATIIIDTNKSDETLLKEMNSGAKNHVRKSLNHNIDFRTATPADYDTFYEERYKVSGFKGFNIIAKSTYIKLMDYLTTNNCGNIFIASKDGVIL